MPQAQPELKKVPILEVNKSLTPTLTNSLTNLVPRQTTLRPTERQSEGYWCATRLRRMSPLFPSALRCLQRPGVLNGRGILTVCAWLGLPKHCPRRSGGREGWRGESEDWDGGM